jgi:hypothetical protein
MRYLRKCPHCKSNKGFEMSYVIKGSGHEIRDFKGNVIDAVRHSADDLDNYVTCLDCKKLIEIEKVRHD